MALNNIDQLVTFYASNDWGQVLMARNAQQQMSRIMLSVFSSANGQQNLYERSAGPQYMEYLGNHVYQMFGVHPRSAAGLQQLLKSRIWNPPQQAVVALRTKIVGLNKRSGYTGESMGRRFPFSRFRTNMARTLGRVQPDGL